METDCRFVSLAECDIELQRKPILIREQISEHRQQATNTGGGRAFNEMFLEQILAAAVLFRRSIDQHPASNGMNGVLYQINYETSFNLSVCPRGYYEWLMTTTRLCG